MKRTCMCGASIEAPDYDAMVSMQAKLKMQEIGQDPIYNFEMQHKDCKPAIKGRIVAYEACTGACAEELAIAVENKMGKYRTDNDEPVGWQPYGDPGIAVYNSGRNEYFQMMVVYG